MNEQELRELLAEQASVIHELRRDAAGMSAIIADLRMRMARMVTREDADRAIAQTMAYYRGGLGRNHEDATKPTEIRSVGKLRCANGDWRSHEEEDQEERA